MRLGTGVLSGSPAKSGPLDFGTKNNFPSFFVREKGLAHIYKKAIHYFPVSYFCFATSQNCIFLPQIEGTLGEDDSRKSSFTFFMTTESCTSTSQITTRNVRAMCPINLKNNNNEHLPVDC